MAYTSRDTKLAIGQPPSATRPARVPPTCPNLRPAHPQPHQPQPPQSIPTFLSLGQSHLRCVRGCEQPLTLRSCFSARGDGEAEDFIEQSLAKAAKDAPKAVPPAVLTTGREAGGFLRTTYLTVNAVLDERNQLVVATASFERVPSTRLWCFVNSTSSILFVFNDAPARRCRCTARCCGGPCSSCGRTRRASRGGR